MTIPNKIAVIGSHGTGKTTLATALFAQYKRTKATQIELVADFARACPYPVGKATTVQAQLWIFESYIAKELRRECDMIFDGNSLQTLAYYEYWFGENADLRQKVAIVADNFTTVVLLPVDNRLCQPDNVRPQGSQFQNDIHHAIVRLLTELEFEYVGLPAYDRRDRMQFVEELIDSI